MTPQDSCCQWPREAKGKAPGWGLVEKRAPRRLTAVWLRRSLVRGRQGKKQPRYGSVEVCPLPDREGPTLRQGNWTFISSYQLVLCGWANPQGFTICQEQAILQGSGSYYSPNSWQLRDQYPAHQREAEQITSTLYSSFSLSLLGLLPVLLLPYPASSSQALLPKNPTEDTLQLSGSKVPPALMTTGSLAS